MKRYFALTLLLLISVGYYYITNQKSLTNSHANGLCQPFGTHIELGTSYQQNVYVDRNETKFANSNEFVVVYQTKGNTCIYGKDIEIEMSPDVPLQRVSNYTSAPDNSTINCAKYGIAKNRDISYTFEDNSLNTSKIILPELFEDKEKAYQICLFNQVEDLNRTNCNMAQLFHYSLAHPFKFFVENRFQEFISSHVIHLVSTFSTYDADLAPFGSKQYYFFLNFMFQMTLDITEPENIHLISDIFEKNVPVAQQNRQSRPWFVAFANNSPYILSKDGISLDSKYNNIYENINSAKFNIIFTSSADSQKLNIFQGVQNNSQFNKLPSGNQVLKAKDGLVIVEIPTISHSPIIFETSLNSFKVIQDERVVLQVEQN